MRLRPAELVACTRPTGFKAVTGQPQCPLAGGKQKKSFPPLSSLFLHSRLQEQKP
jgi:hypothetical protein